MKKISISVTEAARNFADCVNRAHYQDVTFVLLKNGAPVAELAPIVDRVCTGRDLAALLVKTNLENSESRAWRPRFDSLTQGFEEGGPPPIGTAYYSDEAWSS
jgi:antitoxin (DNA-binding transcriptional repressor) of toxin-antitoxin stability system